MSFRRYPRLDADLDKLRDNIERMLMMCRDRGIEMAGVIKGCSGLFRCVEQFEKAGCTIIASSRLEHLRGLRQKGLNAAIMMIRIPMISEAAEVVRETDISLNSEMNVLKELNRQAGLQDRKHKVILMADEGDLREGFWDEEELIEAAVRVENGMRNLKLAGIGTNLGCYGAVEATSDNLGNLVRTAEKIEQMIGRELEFITERGTSSLPLFFEGKLPERINLLRIGEAVLLARDLPELWGIQMDRMYRDVFTLSAEIVEVKDKPTYPVGNIFVDTFGRKPSFEDRGIRKRAIVAIGKADYGSVEDIFPRKEGIEVIGASSDHTILDIEDCGEDLKPGDILEFDIAYGALVYATASQGVRKNYIEKVIY